MIILFQKIGESERKRERERERARERESEREIERVKVKYKWDFRCSNSYQKSHYRHSYKKYIYYLSVS